MVGLPRSIIKKYGVSKKAWVVFRSGKTTKNKRGVRMARKGRKKGGFGMRTSGDPLDAFLTGAGTAAMSKRFIGQLPVVGAFTGTAIAGGYAVVRKKNVIATLAGAAVHDFLGNTGSTNGSFGSVY